MRGNRNCLRGLNVSLVSCRGAQGVFIQAAENAGGASRRDCTALRCIPQGSFRRAGAGAEYTAAMVQGASRDGESSVVSDGARGKSREGGRGREARGRREGVVGPEYISPGH